MLRDADLYPDPDAFVPERFLTDAEPAPSTSPVFSTTSTANTATTSWDASANKNKLRDPRHYVFGFGRRRCPGAHLIEESLWIVMATMVATLDISAPPDKIIAVGIRNAEPDLLKMGGGAHDGRSAAVELGVTFDNAVFRCVWCSLLLSPRFDVLFLTCGAHGLYRTPSAFACEIRPRSPQALKALMQATDSLGV